MRFRVSISDKAKRVLRLLPKRDRQEIGHRIYLMQEDLAGDVTKLKGSLNEYRLRVGDYRVIFRLEGEVIGVYNIGNRKDVYR